jgi:hypothetical protein
MHILMQNLYFWCINYIAPKYINKLTMITLKTTIFIAQLYVFTNKLSIEKGRHQA